MRKLLLIIFFIPLALSAMAQDTVYSSSGKPISQYRLNEEKKAQEQGFDKSKLIFGGGFILSLGDGYFVGGLTPVLGYRISDRFAAGIGLGYQYQSEKYALTNPNNNRPETHSLRTSLYTGSIWARYIVWNNIFLHAEPEYNLGTVKEPYWDYTQMPPPLKKRTYQATFPRMLVGGGLRQPISDRTSFVITVLYDVLKNTTDAYNGSGLDIRFGVNVGF